MLIKLESGAPTMNTIIEAVIDNDARIVQQLLDKGADPNLSLDVARITPLHFAAQNNALDVIPVLIMAGANLHARINPEGMIPLDVAKLHKHTEMVKLLEKYMKMN